MSVPNAAPSAVSTSETTPAISRTNIILLVLLLLQVAVSAYLFWPKSGATGEGQPLLPGVTAEAVTAFTITDDSDRSVNFVKEGESWTLANTDGYPVNSDKITQTLDKLVAITTDRLVTQTPASQGRLQVAEDNFLRKVDLTTASGVQTLYLGSSTGAASTHARAATENATYLTNKVATWELDTQTTPWIDVTYFTVPKEQISEVTLENANGTFTFVRSDNATSDAATGATDSEGWTLADAAPGEPIASANISTLIDRLVRLNLHSVLGKSESPDYGLATPLATLTVTTSEPTTGTTTAETKTTTFVVGAKDEENSAYYFKSSDSDFYVRLAAFTGDEFVNKQRSDFMVQAETPTEGATPQSGPVVGPSPEASAPAVGNTDVPTGTSAIEATATVTSSVATTDTSSAEPTVEPTIEPTVDASDTATDTAASGESEIEATDTPTSTSRSTATPTN